MFTELERESLFERNKGLFSWYFTRFLGTLSKILFIEISNDRIIQYKVKFLEAPWKVLYLEFLGFEKSAQTQFPLLNFRLIRAKEKKKREGGMLNEKQRVSFKTRAKTR